MCVFCSQAVQENTTEQSNNVTPIDGLPVTTMKGKQLPKGIYLTVNDFIAAFDDPLNKKIKRLEMQILEYKQQVRCLLECVFTHTCTQTHTRACAYTHITQCD